MNINMKELESVVAVYQHGSFAEAAFQLSYSVSAVSKHVQSVEEWLGVKIFNRKSYKNSKLLTCEGECLMPYILTVADTMNYIKNTAFKMQEQLSVIKVGGIQIMWGSVIDKILAEFSIRYSNLKVENRNLHLETIMHNITTMEMDCAFFLVNRDDPASFIEAIRKYGSDEIQIQIGRLISDMQIAISEKHPLAAQTEIDLRLLANQIFLFDSDAEQYPLSIAKIAQLTGRDLEHIQKKYIDSKNQNMVLEIVAAGGGVFPCSNMQKIEFPGVRFLSVQNWPQEASLLFVSHRQNQHKGFLELKRYVMNSIPLTRI